jgi:hypothetical protein
MLLMELHLRIKEFISTRPKEAEKSYTCFGSGFS